MDTLTGKVAVVTGAASGIGRALAELLAAEEASVVLADIEEGALEEAASVLDASGAAVLPVVTDVTDPDSVDALAAAAVAEFGTVHVVCNNAGVSGQVGRSWVTPIEDWRWVLEVNVWGVINGIRAFAPILIEQNEGHIINTGSAACFEALPGMGPYGASKHAVLGISETLHRELAGTAVGVSVLIPGDVVNTNIMSSERNWVGRLGEQKPADDDPMAQMIRMGFTHAMANGVDPKRCASAAIEAIRSGAFLVCDNPEQLAAWGTHPADLAAGAEPVWPPPS